MHKRYLIASAVLFLRRARVTPGCKQLKSLLGKRWHLTTDPDARTGFVENLAALSNHYERAMVTFLDHNQFWKGATRFYHADTLPYWRKRKNLPHRLAAVDEASLRELAGLIRTYFHHTEGRGNNCVVEPFRRGELNYFFAYPEDYSQQSIEADRGCKLRAALPKDIARTGLCQQPNQSPLRRNGNWKMASGDRRPKPAPKGRKCQKLPTRDRRPPA